MNNDIKTGIGYVIPVLALIGFIIALAAENFALSMIFAIGGILIWFVYMLVMESRPPEYFGNIVLVFGVLLAVAVFLTYGLERDIFGGYLFKTEGLVFAGIILFFSIMAGVLFRNLSRQQPDHGAAGLTPAEQELVRKALDREGESAPGQKVIVVRPEAPPAEEKPRKEEDEEYDEDYEGYEPYMYAYSPEDYEDWEEEEEEDEEDEEEEEDEK